MFPFNRVIITSWAIFWIIWVIWAFRAKKSAVSYVRKFIGLRITVFLLAVIAFRLINAHNYSFQNRVATNNDILRVIGLVVFYLGLSLAIWARIYLGKNWGFPMSQKQNPELVTSGPYHYIRHPIYTGILLSMLGSSLTSSLFWLAAFVVTGFYFIFSAVQEEKLMLKQFPKDYSKYKSKSKMLIPFIF